MTWGPLELVVLTFPDDRLAEGAAMTLDHLAGSGGVRVADALVVRTELDGTAYAVELTDLDGLRALPSAWDVSAYGLVTEADVAEIAAAVPPGSGAVSVLVEHRWTDDLAEQAARLSGQIVAATRIPDAHAVEATTGR